MPAGSGGHFHAVGTVNGRSAVFLVDTGEGRIVADEEIKLRTANEKPYGQWVRDNLVTLEEVPEAPSAPVARERSEPARSTRLSVAVVTRPPASSHSIAAGASQHCRRASAGAAPEYPKSRLAP